MNAMPSHRKTLLEIPKLLKGEKGKCTYTDKLTILSSA
jgi:hypothetical protein